MTLLEEFFESIELKVFKPHDQYAKVIELRATLHTPIKISGEELIQSANKPQFMVKLIQTKLQNALKTFRYNLKETSDEWEKKKGSDLKNIEEIMTRYKETLKG